MPTKLVSELSSTAERFFRISMDENGLGVDTEKVTQIEQLQKKVFYILDRLTPGASPSDLVNIIKSSGLVTPELARQLKDMFSKAEYAADVPRTYLDSYESKLLLALFPIILEALPPESDYAILGNQILEDARSSFLKDGLGEGRQEASEEQTQKTIVSSTT